MGAKPGGMRCKFNRRRYLRPLSAGKQLARPVFGSPLPASTDGGSHGFAHQFQQLLVQVLVRRGEKTPRTKIDLATLWRRHNPASLLD